MNFAHPPSQSPTLGPWDSRDSGVSSQDCGELTPTTERQVGFPRLSFGQPDNQMNKLVRKLSEVEGIDHSSILRSKKASIDEGVELDCSDSTLSDSSGGCSVHLRGVNEFFPPGDIGSSGRLEENKDFHSGSVASNSSGNCESIESSNFDPGWTQSLPSCSDPGAPPEQEPAQVVGYRGVCRYNPIAPQQLTSLYSYDRGISRSPVSFREGRRASDGLVAQGIIAFQQKLYKKEKATGIVQLHEVRQEAQELRNQFQESRPEETCQNKVPVKQAVSKRISVPENFVYFPPSKHLALQQQLLQHRLLQKRQSLQKQRFSHGEPLAGLRRVSYGKPYLPTDGLNLPQFGSDFLFQPIAEDEPSHETLDYSKKLMYSVSCQPTYSTCTPEPAPPTDLSLGMDCLPQEMETSCKLTDSPGESQNTPQESPNPPNLFRGSPLRSNYSLP